MLNKTKTLASALLISALGEIAMAQESVIYNTMNTQYEGYLVKPSQSGDLDGVSVLFAHDFLGPGENQLTMARSFTERGAVAFVADFYGADIRPGNPEEANIEAMRVRQNIHELRAAMKAALSELIKVGATVEKTAVIGTSVGGLAALELGRSTEKLGSVISLWGVLENTQPDSAQPIQAKVLLLQGDSDPLAPDTAIKQLEAELTSNQTPFESIVYEKTAHAFTLPFVGNNLESGFAYNEQSTLDANHRISKALRALAKQ